MIDKDLVSLETLDGQLIELVLPVQQISEVAIHLGCQMSVVGRVMVSRGDRDCPPHIRIGRSVFLCSTKVRRDWSYVRDLYVLETP